MQGREIPRAFPHIFYKQSIISNITSHIYDVMFLQKTVHHVRVYIYICVYDNMCVIFGSKNAIVFTMAGPSLYKHSVYVQTLCIHTNTLYTYIHHTNTLYTYIHSVYVHTPYIHSIVYTNHMPRLLRSHTPGFPVGNVYPSNHLQTYMKLL